MLTLNHSAKVKVTGKSAAFGRLSRIRNFYFFISTCFIAINAWIMSSRL